MKIVERIEKGVSHEFDNAPVSGESVGREPGIRMLQKAALGAGAIIGRGGAVLMPDDPEDEAGSDAGDGPGRGPMPAKPLAASRYVPDHARIPPGAERRGPPDPPMLDMAAGLRRMEPLLFRLLPGDIDLHLRAAQDLWRGSADPGMMDSILLNLVLNARDAMPDGGTLEVSLDNVEAHAAHDECEKAADSAPPMTTRHVVLTVRDTGTGIDPAIRGRIFVPFASTKPRRTNSGLGLSMVDSLVRRAGGRIEIDSEPGKGATFRLFFRAAEPPSSAARALNILLVEDNPGVRKVLALQLRREGHRVVTAPDGDAGASMAAGMDRLDLLLSGVVMPGAVQGPELAGLLRARIPDLAVIFLAGYPRRGDMPEGARLLHKPVTRQDLLCAVAAACGRL